MKAIVAIAALSASFCGLLCLEHFHSTAKETATESLTLHITGTLAEVKRE